LQANNSDSETDLSAGNTVSLAKDFLNSALKLELEPEHMLRITTTSFMDAYNFDIRQLMKSCVHHILPSGHLIPFSAYNVLYRNGHVALPELTQTPDNTLVQID
jgi:7,8-dihydro-6-hydroxymethylpterin dimethyltransferase